MQSIYLHTLMYAPIAILIYKCRIKIPGDCVSPDYKVLGSAFE